MAYKTGVGAVWVIAGTSLAFLFNWFVLAWRLRSLAAANGAMTLPDVLATRYRGWSALLIRLVGILIVLAMLTAYVAAQLNAAGKTFHGIFGWDYLSGVLIGAGIVLIYTVTGGFRAIAWTDVVQATFMIFTLAVLPLVLIGKLGGPSVFWERLADDPTCRTLTDPCSGNAGLALVGFLSLWLGIPLGNAGQPHVMVRLMAVKDKRAVLRAGIISSSWVLILFSGAVLLGMSARVYFGHLDDPEQILPMVARDSSIVPGVLGGMIIAAMMAAICSTADSQLLVSASAVSHDLYVRILGRKANFRQQRFLDRSAVLLVGGAATVIAAGEVRTVFDFVLDYGWAGLGAGFGPPLILLLLWRRTTGWGVLAGMVTGVSTAVIWKQFPTLQAQLYNLVPAFAVSLASVVIVSYADNSQPPS
jgi:sodium/proline symporter